MIPYRYLVHLHVSMAVPEDRPIARCSEKAQIGDPTHFMIFGIRIGSRLLWMDLFSSLKASAAVVFVLLVQSLSLCLRGHVSSASPPITSAATAHRRLW